MYPFVPLGFVLSFTRIVTKNGSWVDDGFPEEKQIKQLFFPELKGEI